MSGDLSNVCRRFDVILTPWGGVEDMGRKRGQYRGYLRKKSGSWILEYREYLRDENGELKPVKRSVAVARYVGPGAITSERQVRREIVEPMLRQIDQRAVFPATLMTVREFWLNKFEPQHLWKLKPSGQKHYRYLWRKLEPALGHRRLADITPDDVETLMVQWLREGMSRQTVLHLRNAISAVFNHAKRLGFYRGENPARAIRCPSVEPKNRPSLSAQQIRLVLASVQSPVREMLALSVCTSLNVAEVCGLRRKWVNLSSDIRTVDGEILPPFSLAVRENYYEGKWGSVKTGRRKRIVPLTSELAAMLGTVMASAVDSSPEAPVFQSRNGTPVDAHNVSNRVFRPLSERLGFKITWHAFRRAHSTLAGMVADLPVDDRVALMGHADARMTLYYSVADIERRRRVPQAILNAILGMASNDQSMPM